MKRILMMMVAMLGLLVFAEPTVTDVTAKQRYPWNGLVDITCKVTGINGTTNGLKFVVESVMPRSGDVQRVGAFWVVRDGTNSVDRTVHTNGNYRLLWDAQAALGAVVYSNMVTRVTVGDLHDKVQLWEGGPYWATTNIGAEEPEEYGYYFWWGDTIGYKRVNSKWVATDGSSSNVSFGSSSAPTYNKSIATLKSMGWITADEVLTPEHDAAHVQWGGSWRMPTKQELSDLNSQCDWTWTTVDGVNGYVVRGRGAYSSASIFLPCAGYGDGNSLIYAGSSGTYWSSVPHADYDSAWNLNFGLSGRGAIDIYRGYGQSVRPVQGFTK